MKTQKIKPAISTILWATPTLTLLANLYTTLNTNPTLTLWAASTIWSIGTILWIKTSRKPTKTITLWTLAWITATTLPLTSELALAGTGLEKQTQNLATLAAGTLILTVIYTTNTAVNEQKS